MHVFYWSIKIIEKKELCKLLLTVGFCVLLQRLGYSDGISLIHLAHDLKKSVGLPEFLNLLDKEAGGTQRKMLPAGVANYSCC